VQGELNLWPENVEATGQQHGEVDGADGEWQRLEYGSEVASLTCGQRDRSRVVAAR
jgi:hypothetical protein